MKYVRSSGSSIILMLTGYRVGFWNFSFAVILVKDIAFILIGHFCFFSISIQFSICLALALRLVYATIVYIYKQINTLGV